MKHSFNTEVAQEVGVNAAIIFERMAFWINHNKKTGKNFINGVYWTYSTQKEIAEQFEYLTLKQTRTALEKLVESGYLEKGNFNRHKYDKTCWYSLALKGIAKCHRERLEGSKKDSPNALEGEPIPFNNKVKIQSISTDRIEHIRRICGIS